MFTFLNGMSRYDKDGNLIYSTIRLVDTKSKRTLCQTRKNRRKPVLKVKFILSFPIFTSKYIYA